MLQFWDLRNRRPIPILPGNYPTDKSGVYIITNPYFKLENLSNEPLTRKLYVYKVGNTTLIENNFNQYELYNRDLTGFQIHKVKDIASFRDLDTLRPGFYIVSLLDRKDPVKEGQLKNVEVVEKSLYVIGDKMKPGEKRLIIYPLSKNLYVRFGGSGNFCFINRTMDNFYLKIEGERGQELKNYVKFQQNELNHNNFSDINKFYLVLEVENEKVVLHNIKGYLSHVLQNRGLYYNIVRRLPSNPYFDRYKSSFKRWLTNSLKEGFYYLPTHTKRGYREEEVQKEEVGEVEEDEEVVYEIFEDMLTFTVFDNNSFVKSVDAMDPDYLTWLKRDNGNGIKINVVISWLEWLGLTITIEKYAIRVILKEEEEDKFKFEKIEKSYEFLYHLFLNNKLVRNLSERKLFPFIVYRELKFLDVRITGREKEEEKMYYLNKEYNFIKLYNGLITHYNDLFDNLRFPYRFRNLNMFENMRMLFKFLTYIDPGKDDYLRERKIRLREIRLWGVRSCLSEIKGAYSAAMSNEFEKPIEKFNKIFEGLKHILDNTRIGSVKVVIQNIFNEIIMKYAFKGRDYLYKNAKTEFIVENEFREWTRKLFTTKEIEWKKWKIWDVMINIARDFAIYLYVRFKDIFAIDKPKDLRVKFLSDEFDRFIDALLIISKKKEGDPFNILGAEFHTHLYRTLNTAFTIILTEKISGNPTLFYSIIEDLRSLKVDFLSGFHQFQNYYFFDNKFIQILTDDEILNVIEHYMERICFELPGDESASMALIRENDEFFDDEVENEFERSLKGERNAINILLKAIKRNRFIPPIGEIDRLRDFYELLFPLKFFYWQDSPKIEGAENYVKLLEFRMVKLISWSNEVFTSHFISFADEEDLDKMYLKAKGKSMRREFTRLRTERKNKKMFRLFKLYLRTKLTPYQKQRRRIRRMMELYNIEDLPKPEYEVVSMILYNAWHNLRVGFKVFNYSIALEEINEMFFKEKVYDAIVDRVFATRDMYDLDAGIPVIRRVNIDRILKGIDYNFVKMLDKEKKVQKKERRDFREKRRRIRMEYEEDVEIEEEEEGEEEEDVKIEEKGEEEEGEIPRQPQEPFIRPRQPGQIQRIEQGRNNNFSWQFPYHLYDFDKTGNQDKLNDNNKMTQLLTLHQFIETINTIRGDGNCQFSSVSDQLYGTTRYHSFIRRACIKWLELNNINFMLNNGSTLGSFLSRGETWNEYLGKMRLLKTWGDQLTLLVICEMFHVKLALVNTVRDARVRSELDRIEPQNPQLDIETYYLGFYHRNKHYTSIYKTTDSGDRKYPARRNIQNDKFRYIQIHQGRIRIEGLVKSPFFDFLPKTREQQPIRQEEMKIEPKPQPKPQPIQQPRRQPEPKRKIKASDLTYNDILSENYDLTHVVNSFKYDDSRKEGMGFHIKHAESIDVQNAIKEVMKIFIRFNKSLWERFVTGSKLDTLSLKEGYNKLERLNIIHRVKRFYQHILSILIKVKNIPERLKLPPQQPRRKKKSIKLEKLETKEEHENMLKTLYSEMRGIPHFETLFGIEGDERKWAGQTIMKYLAYLPPDLWKYGFRPIEDIPEYATAKERQALFYIQNLVSKYEFKEYGYNQIMDDPQLAIYKQRRTNSKMKKKKKDLSKNTNPPKLNLSKYL